MPDPTFDEELERRLHLLEDPASSDRILDDLPARDVLLAALGLVVLTVVLLLWGYPR
ncbi:hypothetical protein KM427_05655 [Nocardioides sp. LMS-CY]|uniref:Uncharacterized protein n=1 Tax=Nocardioides soli TaxID=1036020 RepID=A0A7W4VWR2_9ACTN|nr:MULTISPECIES: hypothetical protein [Nocardioides]MBB3043135.1 hypothetical protein [Nocardioides soli]QWF23208.1 hypothetical protein KM427_05655 [Nocardioides sp. LMS-CY]